MTRRGVLQAGGVAAGVGVAGAVGLGMTGSATPNSYTFLTQNAWLLDEAWAGWAPRQPEAADGDWLPRSEDAKMVAKPALEERAQELGARFSYSDLDIVGLQEVFDEEQRAQIRDPIQRDLAYAVGPREQATNAAVSSGLYTLSLGGHPILESERMAYENRGSRRRDADAYAQKGVLFTRIGLGDGAVDLFTTHMLAGGGWPGEAVDPSPVRQPTSEAEYRRRQLEEFEAFVRSVKATHDPDGEVPILCAGDFNISPGDPEAGALEAFRRNLGLVDAWETEHPDRQGGTGRSDIVNGCEFDPWNSPPSYCGGGEWESPSRVDYVFVEDRPDIRIEEIRRRVFWRELAPPDQFFADEAETVPNYLADHVGLELSFALAES